MTRQAKTPRQRAEEALAVAERHVDRLTKKVASTRGDLEALEDEWRAAQARRDHLRQHPDLAAPTSTGDNNS